MKTVRFNSKENREQDSVTKNRIDSGYFMAGFFALLLSFVILQRTFEYCLYMQKYILGIHNIESRLGDIEKEIRGKKQ